MQQQNTGGMIVGLKRMIVRRIETRRRSKSSSNCDRNFQARSKPNAHANLVLADQAKPRGRKRSRARFVGVVRMLAGRSKRRRSFAREVEKAISELLSTKEATVESVAERMGLSRQTLHRKLQAEDTNFTELLNVKRQKLAIRYLCRDKTPIKEVAWRLGFSSPEAFSRAFKSWTGSSPGRFRSLRTH